MSDVVYFPGKTLAAVENAPNESIIEMIRALLAAAESGELRTLAVAGQMTGTAVWLSSSGHPIITLGLLEMLKDKVLSSIYADGE